MIALKVSEKLFVLCCIVIFFGGCGPQFIPKQLENRPLSELTELNLSQDRIFQVLEIDGKKKYGLIIYVAPGMHSIKYRVYEETQLWKNVVKVLEEDGYILRPDYRFERTRDGLRKILKPLVSHYGWTTKSKEVSFEGGRKYEIKYDVGSLDLKIISITPTK